MCPDRQILSLYADNELPSPWKEKTEAHLESCAECRSRCDAYRKISAAMLESRPAGEDLQKARDRVWERFPAAMTGESGQGSEGTVLSIVKSEKKSGWKQTIQLPLPLAAAAAAVFIFGVIIGVIGFMMPQYLWISEPIDEPIMAIMSDQGYGNEHNLILPASNLNASDMSEIVRYLSRQESKDFVIMQLPDSRKFNRAGEPALLNRAEYTRKYPGRRMIAP